MRTSALAVASALFFTAGSAAAESLDINLHEYAARLNYTVESDAGTGLELEGGLLYNDAGDTMGHLGAHVSGQNWSKQGTFNIHLGGRIVGLDSDVGDIYALGLGGRVRFSPAERVGVSAHAYYGPKIITWGDGERFLEGGVRVDYHVLPQAFIYLGYRNVTFSVAEREDDLEVDDDVHIGMMLLF